MNQKPYYEVDLKLPAAFTPAHLDEALSKRFKRGYHAYSIIKQSLDARTKPLHWLLKIAVFFSPEAQNAFLEGQKLPIPKVGKKLRVIVVGSGPAGFFSALILATAGFRVTLLEQGPPVEERLAQLRQFETSGKLSPFANYSFGEGGAGTFSDGKLTSRTKNIELEKNFIYQTFIQAQGPSEIAYLQKPHLGSDNLYKMALHMRQMLQNLGVSLHFNTRVTDINTTHNRLVSLTAQDREFEADYFFLAPGHSSYPTYQMLLRHRVPFRAKPFAIGVRVEHSQEIINLSQWGVKNVPGLKAAEYQLTHTTASGTPVFSFCMCPGGKVVPASAQEGHNIVNGASFYQRSGAFANSALVAGVNPKDFLPTDFGPTEVLAWLAALEEKAFDAAENSYKAPANTISAFLAGKISGKFPNTSYPLGLIPANFKSLLPAPVHLALLESMKVFAKRVPGFESGLMLGLETKTSAPLQVIREKDGSSGFPNLFVLGEASGYAGGIISSAVDGIKSALQLISQNQ